MKERRDGIWWISFDSLHINTSNVHQMRYNIPINTKSSLVEYLAESDIQLNCRDSQSQKSCSLKSNLGPFEFNSKFYVQVIDEVGLKMRLGGQLFWCRLYAYIGSGPEKIQGDLA